MPPIAQRRQPSSGINKDALPAANQLSFSQQWRPMRVVQRERRELTDELWRRLDDLVTDASDFPLPLEPSPSRPYAPAPAVDTLRPELLGRADLMGVVFWRRADRAAYERGPSSTGDEVGADAR